MHSTVSTIGSAGAVLCLAAGAAAAQVMNNDQTQVLVGMAASSGQYAPGAAGVGRRSRPAPVTPYTVGMQARLFLGGSRDEQALGFALGGGSTTPLADGLIDAGAPAGEVRVLMSALHALAIKPSQPALAAAIKAYNARIRAAPAGFISDPPAQLTQTRRALLAIRAGV